MPFKKRILKHPRTQWILSWFLAAYIWLVYVTSSKIRLIDDEAMTYMRGEQNAIFAFWHGRMMLLPAFNPPTRKMRVLISLHRDGLLISQVIGHFNQATVGGSSSKGGKAAVMEILRTLKAGDNISITPDGPRGPAYVAEKGIVTVAKLSGRPVLPVTFSSTRSKRLKSWDRFMIALPFGRIVFCVGKPIVIARDTDEAAEELARADIDRAMNDLLETADKKTHA